MSFWVVEEEDIVGIINRTSEGVFASLRISYSHEQLIRRESAVQ